MVSKITKSYKLNQLTLLIFLPSMFTLEIEHYLLSFLLVVLSGMFLHHVSLEMIRSVALVVAVVTGKRLLASVRSHVPF